MRREPPPPPPGGRTENYPPPGGRDENYDHRGRAGAVEGWERERGPEWDRGAAHRDELRAAGDQSEWDHHSRRDRSEPRDHSGWDRSGPEDRSSAPMRDRSVSEYSVSVPGRRRAAPPAWDGTLDGVASRWGTLERPAAAAAAADEQLQQLDSALARQRQLLTATAAAAAGEQTAQERFAQSVSDGTDRDWW